MKRIRSSGDREMDSPSLSSELRRVMRLIPLRLGLCLGLCLGLGLMTGTAQAQESIFKEASSSNSFTATSGISLKQATAIARKEMGGRVLSAKPYRRGGTHGYQVRLFIDEERVVSVIVDSEGRIKHKK